MVLVLACDAEFEPFQFSFMTKGKSVTVLGERRGGLSPNNNA